MTQFDIFICSYFYVIYSKFCSAYLMVYLNDLINGSYWLAYKTTIALLFHANLDLNLKNTIFISKIIYKLYSEYTVVDQLVVLIRPNALVDKLLCMMLNFTWSLISGRSWPQFQNWLRSDSEIIQVIKKKVGVSLNLVRPLS